MTQQEERKGERERSGPTKAAFELMGEGRRRMEDFADAQAQFWDRVQDSNRKWLDRIQSEASMATDFANKLTSAKSLMETASIFQNWTVKHMELATEDARRMLSDTQEIIAAGARFWTAIGNGGSRAH